MMQFRLQVVALAHTFPQPVPPSHTADVVSVNPEVAAWDVDEETHKPDSTSAIMIRTSVVIDTSIDTITEATLRQARRDVLRLIK